MKVENLKKVTLEIKAGEGELERESKISSNSHITFIYGVASDGLSSLERALAGKKVGDCLYYQFTDGEDHRGGGHLHQALCATLGGKFVPGCTLEIRVLEVTTPQNSEVIQAMSRGVQGCGGSCDCGCG